MITTSGILSQILGASSGTIAAFFFISFVLYLIILAVFRLYISPLSKFPGPKLAALSRWYEFYYDVVLRGQFSNHIVELHNKYGPIVRITPEEVHVSDPPFFDTLFNKNTKSEKSPWFNGRFNNHHSVFSTCDPNLHKLRREMLNPFFSKRVVGQQEDIVQSKLDYICSKILDYTASDKKINLTGMWDAYSSDVIMEYSFGFCYDHLKSEDFMETFHDAFLALGEFGALGCQYPILGAILEALPEWIVRMMSPRLDRVLTLTRDLSNEVSKTKIALQQGKVPGRPTIFFELLAQDVPPAELNSHRMRDEAQTLVGAGLTTTSWSLTSACFYIIQTPGVQEKLHRELVQAIPDTCVAGAMDYQKLEALPYLRGCVKEGIRLGIGVSGRMHRVVRTPLPYRDWVIPSGAIVSMNHQNIVCDPHIFPQPYKMVPERWIGHQKAFDGSSLERYFVPFSRGDRQCLGINLAYMEIFMALGNIFRKFRLELYDTDHTDVLMVHDFFLPSPKLGTKGVRVRVAQIYEK